MNIVSFDNNWNCIITVPSKSFKISFLTNPLFSNSSDDLKKDIECCHDNAIKSKLEQFLKDIENGRFDFMDWQIHNEVDYTYCRTMDNYDNLQFIEEDNNDGRWMAVVHNVQAEHTGFWYAAMNIVDEINNIKEYIHILQGYYKVTGQLDDLILLIKNFISDENSVNKLIKQGYTDIQTRAILNFKLTDLTRLEKNNLYQEINNFSRLVEILNEYV